jgi:hypothetical protein
MSDLKVGDWAKAKRSGFRGKISSIHEIGGNTWVVLRLPFDEETNCTARFEELVPCDPVTVPSKVKYKAPPDPRTEAFLRRGSTQSTMIVRRKKSKIVWPDDVSMTNSRDRWGMYGEPTARPRRTVVREKPKKRESFSTADLINDEIKKSAKERANSGETPSRKPIRRKKRLLIRPKFDD